MQVFGRGMRVVDGGGMGVEHVFRGEAEHHGTVILLGMNDSRSIVTVELKLLNCAHLKILKSAHHKIPHVCRMMSEDEWVGGRNEGMKHEFRDGAVHHGSVHHMIASCWRSLDSRRDG